VPTLAQNPRRPGQPLSWLCKGEHAAVYVGTSFRACSGDGGYGIPRRAKHDLLGRQLFLGPPRDDNPFLIADQSQRQRAGVPRSTPSKSTTFAVRSRGSHPSASLRAGSSQRTRGMGHPFRSCAHLRQNPHPLAKYARRVGHPVGVPLQTVNVKRPSRLNYTGTFNLSLKIG
jgi:hypothetical protein